MLVNYRRQTVNLGMRQLPTEASVINEHNLKNHQSLFLGKSLGLGISLGVALGKGLGHLVGYQATK